MSIPALDRGLLIVEQVLLAGDALRYRRLKEAVDGIGDASLNRILKTLVDGGYIEKNGDGRYARGIQLKRWRSEITSLASLDVLIQTEVDALVRSTRESVAYARLGDDGIRIIHSASCQDSVTVMPAGGVLHFEADHAGALAILEQLDDCARRAAIASPHSAIESTTQLDCALQNARKGPVFLDRSRARIGVSRMAIALSDGGKAASLFFCLPTERMLACERELARALCSAAEAIGRHGRSPRATGD